MKKTIIILLVLFTVTLLCSCSLVSEEDSLAKQELDEANAKIEELEYENEELQYDYDILEDEYYASSYDDGYVLNTNTKKFHHTWCSSVEDMSEKNKEAFNGTRDEAISMGYDPCGRCNP